MSTIEIFATAFGLACVYLTVKQNIWCWPTGIIMAFLYIFIFYDAKLYSDAFLQVIYVFMQFYGWYHWLHGGKDKKELPVTLLKKRDRVLWSLLGITSTIGIGYFLATYTDASFPYVDTFIMTTSLIAQWFLSIKKLESWVLWITIDVVAIYVYFMKDLHLTSGLYAVFLILASLGFIEWKKSLKKHAAHK